jgi:Phage tail lysozyme
MAEQNLKVIITAVDRASIKFEEINHRLERLSSPVRELGERLAHLAEASGLRRISEHAAEAFEHVKRLGEKLEEVAGPALALGGALGVAGLASMARRTAEFGEQITLMSKATGIGAQQLAGLRYAGEIAGVGWDVSSRAIENFNKQLGLAASGRAPQVAAELANMGLVNTPQHLLNTAAGLRAVSFEIKHLLDTHQVATATALASDLFGQRSGAKMLPLLGQGPAHIQQLINTAIRSGYAPTDKELNEDKDFLENFRAMTAAVNGLEFAIGNKLIPVLSPMLDSLAKWITLNKDWIATGIGSAVRDLSDRITNFSHSGGFRRISEQLHEMGRVARWTFDHLGGVEGVLGVIAALEFGPAIFKFGRLAIEIGRAATALGLVMFSNPYGAAAVVGVALLAAGAYEVYEHWKPISAFFKQIGRDISTTFWAAVHSVGKAFDWLAAYIKPVLDPILDAMRWIDKQFPTQVPSPNNIRARNIYEQHHHVTLGLPAPMGTTAGAQQMNAWLRGHGYSPAATAAIMGNAWVESRFNPAALGPGNHRGLFQWDRNRWAGGDFDAQMAHMDEELRRIDPAFRTATGNPQRLAMRFEHEFERSGGQMLSERMARAALYSGQQQKARIELHVSSDSNLRTGLKSLATEGDPDMSLNVGQQMAY